jgi:predicted O-methyltransferase YrrM
VAGTIPPADLHGQWLRAVVSARLAEFVVNDPWMWSIIVRMTAVANVKTARPSLRQRFVDNAPDIVAAIRCLARHPEVIATIGDRYRADPTVGNSRPWWNKRAIGYLDAELNRGDRVFEWGSGGSTAWLVSKGAQVTSVESEPEWVDKVRALCPEADVRAIPATETGTITRKRNWLISGYRPRFFDDYVAAIDEFPDGSFDVVIVDGMRRRECLQRALPKVRPGGLLIVDDTDFWPARFLRKCAPGWERKSFAGFKATKDLRETTFLRRPR